jgi:alanyl-tRNA synthetase
LCRVASGALAVGLQGTAAVDYAQRRATAAHHTLTHVLNHCLQAELGGQVAQKGSQVTPDKLRFDFSHAKALTPQQVASVEASVAAVVAAALPVFTQVVPLDAARAISGLRAVFGETYPDPVRVVSVTHLSPFRA